MWGTKECEADRALIALLAASLPGRLWQSVWPVRLVIDLSERPPNRPANSDARGSAAIWTRRQARAGCRER